MHEPLFETALELIEQRRTNLRIDPDAPVSPTLIHRLCRAAVWAPNHKLTEPWRFAALSGAARRTLGDVTAAALATDGVSDSARLEMTRNKYLRAPVILVVGSAPCDDPMRRTEDRDAVAAGVQNLLLAATAAGLASFWATGIAARTEEVVDLCGFEPGTEVVALIYLGWPTGAAPATRRAEPDIRWLTD